MNVTDFNHIAINARDFDKTLSFYRDTLGFKQLNTVITEEFSATYLMIPGGSRIELFDLKGKHRQTEKTDNDVGVRHYAFTVVDVASHARALEEAGVEIVLPCCDLGNFNARVVLFKDPDGNILEFCEDLK